MAELKKQEYKYYLSHPMMGEKEVTRSQWYRAMRECVKKEDVRFSVLYVAELDAWDAENSSGISGRRVLQPSRPLMEFEFLVDWGPVQKGRIAKELDVGPDLPYRYDGSFYFPVTKGFELDDTDAWLEFRLKKEAMLDLEKRGIVRRTSPLN